MTKKLFAVLALGLVLVGCGPDPVKFEKAGAIRRESEALYLATATHVAIREKANSVAIAATATAIADEEQVRAETQPERIVRQENVIWWSTASLVVFMLALAASLSLAVSGGAVAVVRYANLQAKLIWLNEATRTFPILLDKGWLADLEAGERARLDSPNIPHPGRLIGSVQARVTGLLAQAATGIAKTKTPQPADMLPAIGQSVPLLEANASWLPELRGN